MGQRQRQPSPPAPTPSAPRPALRPPAPSRTLVPALALLLLTLLAFATSLPGQWIWDDGQWLLHCQPVHAWNGLVDIWCHPDRTPHYYPLVFTTFWTEHKLWGLDPLGYHVVNTLLHAAAAILLWRVLRRLDLPAAWFAAALWAIHPVQVESVAWVTERKNVLSGLFFFAAILTYLRFVALGEPSPHPVIRRPWKLYALTAFWFLLALLSKTVTCPLPVVLAILLWWKHRLRWRDLWPLLPLLALGLGLAAWTAYLEREHTGTDGPEWAFSLLQRTLLASHALWFYLGKLLWPHPLLEIYPRWGIDTPQTWHPTAFDYLYLLATVVLAAALLATHRRLGRGPLAAVACFVVLLSPALCFINFYTMFYTFVADHYQYLASAALLVLLAQLAYHAGTWLLTRTTLPPARRLTLAYFASAALLVALGFQTAVQGILYCNPITLWTYTIQYNPTCFAALNNLGNEILRRPPDHPKDAEAYYRQALQDAEACYQQARAAKPSDHRAWYNLGWIAYHRGQLDQAAEFFRQSEARKPLLTRRQETAAFENTSPAAPDQNLGGWSAPATDTNYMLGLACEKQGQFDKAIPFYQASLAQNPKHVSALYALGNCYLQRGRPDDLPLAIAAYRAALALAPQRADVWFNLALTLRQAGQGNEAADALQHAYQLNPKLLTPASGQTGRGTP